MNEYININNIKIHIMIIICYFEIQNIFHLNNISFIIKFKIQTTKYENSRVSINYYQHFLLISY
jgi:hypothetical protein